MYNEALEQCLTYEEVDAVLESPRVSEILAGSFERKEDYLKRYMGVIAESKLGYLTPEEEYKVAVEGFLSGIWRLYRE